MGAGVSSPHFPLKEELAFLNEWTSDDAEDFGSDLAHSSAYFGLTHDMFNNVVPGGEGANSKALFDSFVDLGRNDQLSGVKRQGPAMINSLAVAAAITVVTSVNEQSMDADLARALYDVFDFNNQGKGLTFDMLSAGLYCTLSGLLALSGKPREELPLDPSREFVQAIAGKAFRMFQKVGIECGPCPAPPDNALSYEEFTFWLTNTIAGLGDANPNGDPEVSCEDMDFDEILLRLKAYYDTV